MFLALPMACGCASPLLAEDGGFRDTKYGFWVAAPPPLAPPWERADVEGAVLSYRRPGPTWMSLQVRCKTPLASPRILARHLLFGLPEYTIREAFAAEGDLPGWVQVFDTRTDDGRVVRVKTVTLVGRGCVFDWILTAHGGQGFAQSAASFDAWWPTLRLDEEGAGEVKTP